METWSQRDFDAQVRPIKFVQDNESKSSYGVLRGLHFQKGKDAQSKLVRVLKGSVLDVAVDIRKGSPTFGKHVMVELTGENHRQGRTTKRADYFTMPLKPMKARARIPTEMMAMGTPLKAVPISLGSMSKAALS